MQQFLSTPTREINAMLETVNILLVEDTSSDERIICGLLAEAGRVRFHVDARTSFRSAADYLKQQEPDVISKDCRRITATSSCWTSSCPTARVSSRL